MRTHTCVMSAIAGSLRFPGRHKRVLIDTSIWIYHLEQHAEFAAPAGLVIESLQSGKFLGVVSELALLELTVKPLQLQRQDVADQYEVLLQHFPNLHILPVDREILLQAAQLRATHRLKTPDAIQLATGLRWKATLAVTNDAAWRDLTGIETLLLSDLE